MAATVGVPSVSVGKDPGSPVFRDLVLITGGNPYATGGGEPIDALIKAQIGADRTIINVKPLIPAGGTTPWISGYDRTAGKLMLFTYAGAEVAAVDTTSYSVIHEVTSY